MPEKQVKILFKFYSEILDEWTVETMWATPVDPDNGLYKLDNIPFHTPLISSDDIVLAEYDESELMLIYRHTVEHSGNSTIHVVMMDNDTNINFVRDIFKEWGCVSERANEGYFAMEVLATTNYEPIREKLVELEAKGVIGFAEACLSEDHRY